MPLVSTQCRTLVVDAIQVLLGRIQQHEGARAQGMDGLRESRTYRPASSRDQYAFPFVGVGEARHVDAVACLGEKAVPANVVKIQLHRRADAII